jgi:RNA polymerase sigma-70 factor (ECF subfamily)
MPGTQQAQPTAASDPEQWVNHHGDALYRYALLRVRDPEQAEEAVQECLLAALASRESFAGRSAERTWLIGILKRKLVDHLRRRKRERPLGESEELRSTDSVEAAFFDEKGSWKVSPAKWGGDPGRHLERREFWGVFQRCLKDLPSALAEAFLLREVDQVESKDICDVLGLSPTNLWTRLHRARLALRACLESHWFGGRKGKVKGGGK